MNHDELVKYVEGMKKQELTSTAFDDFVRGARSVFEPQGTNLIMHLRVGKNKASERMFEDGKRPKWDEFESSEGRSTLTTKEIVVKGEKTPKRDGRFFVVYFDGDWESEVFGMNRARPLKFAFDAGKSLYIAEECDNGTPELPYESLFLRQ
jgi:hypothetical protein